MRGQLAEASPLLACQRLADDAVKGKIGVTERGGCMFVDKVCDLLVNILFLLVSLWAVDFKLYVVLYRLVTWRQPVHWA